MNQPPVLLTMGDACGIGPEIVAKAFVQDGGTDLCVVGDAELMQRELGASMPVARLASPMDLAPPHCLPVWQPVDLPKGLLELPRGLIDARAGLAAARCVSAAVRAIQQGEGRAMVTAPIHKEALHAAGIAHPGHTEMLQELAAQGSGVLRPVRMMLANEELRVVLVTIHCSLRQAVEQVSFESVLQTIRIADAALRRFGLVRPRIAVSGLNPHAGEGGLFGSEEIDHIEPAIKAARGDGVDARGPFAPDTVFMRARKGEFDAVIAMTHDQGLIPVKYLGVENGVNVTLGLPFVRTSPDHGTAFDIAGKGRADANSMLAAIRMARRLAQAQ
ncbi:MAG: 4-hydroxythreonine-4-phosphate dehydrogenase PdxA [Paucibacter sp.]|nr:4-hydroxythreonine-4-phosphate dehydrogenase PdxA [Roseateles sp.]